MPVAKGQWEFHEKLYQERVIPVQVVASREQIEQIVNITMEYYDQLAVMAYKLSDDVILRHRDGQGDLG